MAQYREAKTPASQGKKLDHLRVSEGEDGGHLVEHHYAEDGMMYHKPKQYTFGADEGGEVLKHVAKHMNIRGHAAEPEPESPDREREEEEVE